ncbi:hypothetical protein [Caballeronia grimmiae]|uniref:Integrase n=1 Tax=Caballeronia grimmiae TaxID=1071679 RepID=A0ABQ1RVC4_9BURK|nr:hypothetical protein [Caballeronia grimmiae]GGD84334.1 hypothetical protein GCM10010985_43570 [Caballeronia grimmiae]
MAIRHVGGVGVRAIVTPPLPVDAELLRAQPINRRHARPFYAPQRVQIAMRKHFPEAQCIHVPRDSHAASRTAPQLRLPPRDIGTIRHQRRRRVTAHTARADRREQRAMTREQTQRIMGHAAAGAEQHHRYRLVRDLIDVLPTREMQASVNDAEFASLQPHQSMTIRMRHAGCVEP